MCKADDNTYYFCNKRFCDDCEFQGEPDEQDNQEESQKTD